jgi:hypothetical protein
MDMFFNAITIRGGGFLEPLEPQDPGDTHLSRHTGIKIRSTCIAPISWQDTLALAMFEKSIAALPARSFMIIDRFCMSQCLHPLLIMDSES